jgi:hypothetical protein
MTLAIKKVLTPEQQARALALRRTPLDQLPAEAIRAKLQQVQDRTRAAQAAGRDVSAVRPLLRETEPLVRDGKVDAAAAILERAAKLLDEVEKQ